VVPAHPIAGPSLLSIRDTGVPSGAARCAISHQKAFAGTGEFPLEGMMVETFGREDD